MRGLTLAVVMLLMIPVLAGATGSVPAPGQTPILPGLREWDASRAEAMRLLRELKADSAHAKAAQRIERDWLALDRTMQKVRALQAQGKLDAKTARASADRLAAEMRQLENAVEETRNKRQMDTTAFQNFDQKSNQLMNMLSSVIKTMGEMRGIGAGSKSGL